MTDLEQGFEAYNNGDYKTAVSIIKPFAEKGVAPAQGLLATMFEEGHGVPQNYSEMIKFYKLSAQQGEPQAQFKLAEKLFQGVGIERDIIQAHIWANLAASNGHEYAVSLRGAIENEMSDEEITKTQDAALELLKEYPQASNLSILITKSDTA